MTTLYAQPYDISAVGFYFDNADDFMDKSRNLRNEYGSPVEEFEIQFIDGDAIDCRLFEALAVNQCTATRFFDAVEDWDDDDKIKVIVAVGEAGCSFDLSRDRPDRFDVDLYACDSMRDLAMHFVDDGLYGDIPASIQNYLGYEAIARDLEMDYSSIRIDGATYIYRCV